MDFKLIAAAIGILFVFIYAFGSGIWVSSSPGWYSTLNRPSWQPPSAFIGLIWPYNFAVLGIASYQVSRSLTRIENVTWLVFFGLSIAAALTWAYQFYVPHNFLYASLALTSAALLTLPMLLLTFRASLAMGLLLVPYQIWVAIAASLAWGYLAKN
ncbi:MAG: tryptophan-rich sensory protein [Actinobacteria bacterium]|nr:tryptophan-rich sensory protein [Actinomycetota bacterium]